MRIGRDVKEAGESAAAALVRDKMNRSSGALEFETLKDQKGNDAEITAQQLDRLFELFLACREMDGEARNAWLQEACQGDLSLERGVHSLILADASADGFLSNPLGFVKQAFSLSIAEGQRFGRYTITGFLGRGGMGEVWKAHDEELDRPVALKFIFSGFPVDQLTREARIASALNHPGIVTVHDVTLWAGTPILVMELVTGTPLSRSCNGLMPLEQLVSVAAQTAGALAAAHRAGIIHGDLKPDNIVWREDGLAKILDFGLARKLSIGSNATATALAGTPLYMSPEQARRETLTAATDVYSLGLVLFELATGQRPFGRPSLEETGARRGSTPKASRLRSQLPGRLDQLIGSMLRPEPSNRIGMQEAAEQLRTLERPVSQRPSWKTMAVAVGLVAAAAIVVWLWVHYAVRQSRGQLDFAHMSVHPLASQPGLEDNPSISPDGLWIACLYRSRAADHPQLQVHSIRGGPPVVIATGALVVQGAVAWSPDSSELIFSALAGVHDHALYRVSRKGGLPTQIFVCRPRTDSGCEMDWSPDGKTLAIADRWPGNSELYLLDLAGHGRRDLLPLDRLYLTKPRFSPDGRSIAYLKQTSLSNCDLYVVAAAGGPPRALSQGAILSGFAWEMDGRSLATVGSSSGNKPQLRQFPITGGAANRVAELDAGRGSGLSLSRNKGSLAWVRDLNANSLWRMPVDREGGPPAMLANSAALDIDADLSSDGRMVFRSDRSGVTELWIANADGTSPRQATQVRGAFVGDAHWSPDGRSIAFTSHAKGNPDIFVMRCDRDAAGCSEPRQLTQTHSSDANPTWSADGRWIYFSSDRSGEFEVWRMRAEDGSDPVRITWTGGYVARESADGKRLYYSKLWQSRGFWRIELPARGPGQAETPVMLNIPFIAGATWALGRRELFYYPSTSDPAVPFPSVRAVDLQTGSARELPIGNIRLGRGLALSPDEHWLLRSQNDRAQTLVMIAE